MTNEHTQEYNRAWQSRNKDKVKENSRKWRAANRDKVRKLYREYNKRWRAKLREKARLLVGLWYELNIEKLGDPAGQWDSKHPIARAAHHLVNEAVKVGLLVRPSSCCCCGKKATVHGHHYDYTKALEVFWLCASCHGNLHYLMKLRS
jgi:hypothetical protein